MSTPSAWRQFNFFTASPVKDTHDLASPPDTFKNISDIACITQSSRGLLVADIHGSINLLDSDFEVSKTWVAHENGHVTHLVEKRGILITLIEEVGIRYPILKIWDLEHTSNDAPPLLRSAKIQTGTRPHPVSTVALSQGISHLAVGLADGTILFFRNLDQYLFGNSTQLNHLPKPKTILEASGDSVTGLGFREPLHHSHKHDGTMSKGAANTHTRTVSLMEDPSNENLYLFIVTLSQFLSYQVTGRGTGHPPVVVDDLGADNGCATMNARATDMIIARSEALYLAHVDGRGPSFAVEGPKTSILSHKGYVVIVSPPITPSALSGSATVRKRAVEGVKEDVTRVLVFDMDNRLIAYSDTFREEIKTVFTCWGGLFVLTNGSTLYRLNEASTSAKLDTFFARANYALAVSLAHNQGLDSTAIADIHRRYGDQFYNSGDHEGAMDQYVKTIGEVQPSYVIRKYLDAQRIQCLVEYLQELHNRGLANPDHTTLLLNAYTKMKDVARLDAFIRAAEATGDSNADEREAKGDSGASEKPAKKDLPFDLETVIRVCRQAGYFSHAVYLAKKYERHEDYLRIQIEDAGNYKDALDYVRKLGSAASESNLSRYGRVLLEKMPEETTQLLIDICTGAGFITQPPVEHQSQTQDQAGKGQAVSGGPSYLSYLAYNRKDTVGGGDGASTTGATVKDKDSVTGATDGEKDTATAVVAAGVSTGVATAVAGASAVEPGHRKRLSTTRGSIHSGSRAPSPPLTAALVPGTKFKIPVRKPSPRVYFAHFVDHPEHFVRFLEAVAWNRWGQKVDVQQGATENKKTAAAGAEELLDEESNKADHSAVWNTLIELYLTLSSSALSKTPSDEKTAKTNRTKTLHVLKSSFEYDSTHALLVCSTRRFTDGLILLWEKLGMYEDILRFWMDLENTPSAEAFRAAGIGNVQPSSQVLKYLERYGASNPNLYPLVLRFLTSTPTLLQRHTTELTGILEHIEQEKIMPPLAVVQVLSRNGVASVGLVKDWVMRRIKESRDEISSDRRLIDSYRAETAAKLKDIAELSNPDAPKVFHVTKCSSCEGGLELPVIHFMCKHSYHQRCLGEHDDECPVCAKQHGVIRQLRRANQRLAEQHDVFLADVEENGFSAIATAFSQGIMGAPRADGNLQM